jgi:hypothetical protein
MIRRVGLVHSSNSSSCRRVGSASLALALVIGNRWIQRSLLKRTLFLGLSRGVGVALARQVAAITGVVAGVLGGVGGSSKFSFFSTTWLWCWRRSSPFLGRSSNLLVSALGLAPSFSRRYIILKLKRDRNLD